MSLLTTIDEDAGENTSDNPTFMSLVAERYSRRATLFGGLTATGAAVFGLAACDSDSSSQGNDLPAPVVSAGQAITTSSGKKVTLNGAVQNAGSGTPSVFWTQLSGTPVTIGDPQSTTASFIAPAVASSTPLVFRLNVVTAQGLQASGDAAVTVGPARLDFAAVPKNLNDIVTLPAGYSMSVLYRLGDPLAAGVPAARNDGTDTNYAQRAGDHHDGMYYFGLAATGNVRDDASNSRGVLAVNHESVTEQYLHPNGATFVNGVRTVEAEVRREIECHGVGLLEVRRGADAQWSYVQDSPLNRRITPNTPMTIHGPARGSGQLRTKYSPTGVAGRGTVNNCANGYAPWGTYLTCEEN